MTDWFVLLDAVRAVRRPRSGPLVMLSLWMGLAAFAEEPAWPRHTVDDSSRGADGVRLADVDGDGRLDVVTGWEEGGLVRVYRQPPVADVRNPWPAVSVGRVSSPEDAVFADIDGTGRLAVISCCEGATRTVYVHRPPDGIGRFGETMSWSTEPVPVTAGLQMWMYCLPLNGRFVVGSKGPGASISLLSPGAARGRVNDWSLRQLCDAGWIMSLCAVDMDGDGAADLLYSDRIGPTRGVHWLRPPQRPELDAWERNTLGGTGEEVMFLTVGDLTDDGQDDVVVATKSSGVLVFRRHAAGEWDELMIPLPPRCGTGKGVAIADVDQDGRVDIVVSCEQAAGKHGVFWLARTTTSIDGPWAFHPISGLEEGVKFDRIEMIDPDGDGDLDVLTCEERDNLGVVWYENRLR